MAKRTYIKLELRNLRSLVDSLCEGVTDLDRLDLLGELGKELVVNPGLNVDTTASTASLAVVPAGGVTRLTPVGSNKSETH